MMLGLEFVLLLILVLPAGIGLLPSALAQTDAPTRAAFDDPGADIYRDGRGHGGRPIVGRHAAGGWRLQGAVVACGNCHGSERAGGPEGAVAAPSLRWVDDDPDRRRQLRTALVEGRGRDGRRLDSTMPRFELDDADFDALAGWLARANAGTAPGQDLPKLVTLMPKASQRLPVEAALVRGLEACLGPLTGGARPALVWELREYASPAEALQFWQAAAGDSRVAALVSPSLRGWHEAWREAWRESPGPASAPTLLFPLVDEPSVVNDRDAVRWLFGGSDQREQALAMARLDPGGSRRLLVLPARSATHDNRPSRALGQQWAEAGCAVIKAVTARSWEAPAGLARRPADRFRWALARVGRIETIDGWTLEPHLPVAVNHWAIWEQTEAAGPRMVEPWVRAEASLPSPAGPR